VRINNDKKDIIYLRYLRVKPDEIYKISDALIIKDLNKIKPVVAELTLFDNKNSLYGNLSVIDSSDDKITMSMEIERNDKDTIKNEIIRQIINQNNIGVNAYANVTLLPTTYPKNDGQLVLKKRVPAARGETSEMPTNLELATATDAQLPDVPLPAALLAALKGTDYEATIEGKTDEMQFAYAHFEDVVVKTDWDTTGRLNVEMKERRLPDLISAGVGRVASNLKFAAKRTKTRPIGIFGRRITAKHTAIQEGEVEYKAFDGLVDFLMEISDDKSEITPELMAVNVRVKTRGLYTLSGEAIDFDYDKDNDVLRFTIPSPETKNGSDLLFQESSWSWLADSWTDGSKIEFTVGRTTKRAKLAVGASAIRRDE
jgi:hypothetical protein